MTKEEFKICSKDALNDITNRIDELRQRSNRIDEDIEREYHDKINQMLVLRDELDQLIDKVDDESKETTWEDVKKEFNFGLEYLEKGFDKLIHILSN
ncbi:hypothetical protein GO491_10920 [Flavobacteriaceae bacterium Ap0902]|nr:hypothetical protein [Flavobacteriaceae bacterium Ap0902]